MYFTVVIINDFILYNSLYRKRLLCAVSRNHLKKEKSDTSTSTDKIISDPSPFLPICGGLLFFGIIIIYIFYIHWMWYYIASLASDSAHSVQKDDIDGHMQKIHSNEDYLLSEDDDVCFYKVLHVIKY